MAPELLVEALSGILIVPIIQVIKRYTKLEGVPMAWVSAIICLIAGTGLAFQTGAVNLQLSVQDPFEFLSQIGQIGGAIFGCSQLFYRTVRDRLFKTSNGKKGG